MRPIAIVAAVLASSCSEAALLVEIPAPPRDLVLPLLLDADDLPERTLPAFGAAIGEPGLRQTLTRDARLVFVSLELEILASSVIADPARLREVALEIGAPPASPSDSLGVATLALPAGARIEGLDLGPPAVLVAVEQGIESKLRSGLTLRVPVDPEPCRIAGVEALTPFPARDIPPHQIKSVRILDRDRVLVSTRQALFLAERGRSVLEPSRAPVRYAPSSDDGALVSLAVDPIARPDGSRAAAVLVSTDAGRRLIDVEIGAAGMAVTATAAIDGAWLTDAGFDHQGVLVLIGRDRLLTRAPGGPLIERRPPDSDLRTFGATGDSAAPHAISSSYPVEVFIGDAVAGTWESDMLSAFATEANPDVAFDAAGDAWAGVGGWLLERIGGVWLDRSADVRYAPRYAPCLNPASGSPHEIYAVALIPSHVLVVSACNALLAVHRAGRDRLCSTVVPQAGRAVASYPDRQLRSIDASTELIVVGGDEGWLYEGRLF